MIFDCQHRGDIGYFTSKGLFCSLCASNRVRIASDVDTPLKSKARPVLRHSRGDIARAKQLAYQDFKAKLPHYTEDKLLKLARINAKSYLVKLAIAVFVAHPQYFLYLWHGRVAMMQTGIC